MTEFDLPTSLYWRGKRTKEVINESRVTRKREKNLYKNSDKKCGMDKRAISNRKEGMLS
jgi:hypothetical protein